jgi:NSS family neurotransmitter:Na+ symporter
MTLPTVFNQMPWAMYGRAVLLFMSFAALSTIIAVFENIVAFAMDPADGAEKGHRGQRRGADPAVSALCAGFNVWSGLPPRWATSRNLEDFVVSNNLLPLGSLFTCVLQLRRGWGWKSFIEEARCRQGVKFPSGPGICQPHPAHHRAGHLRMGYFQSFRKIRGRAPGDGLLRGPSLSAAKDLQTPCELV